MRARGLNVAVVGAGIGGLATAAGLRRGGADVVVSETASQLRAAGSALTLWSNGVAALRSLGLEAHLPSRSEPFARVVSLAGGDRVVGDWRLATTVAPSVTVVRSDLLSLLAEDLGDAVRFGSPVRSVGEDGAAAYVEVQPGRRELFDLVVCADGAGSRLRRCFDAAAVAARAATWQGWQGITGGPVDGIPGDALTGVYGRRAGGVSPLPGGRMHWFVDRSGSDAPPPDAGTHAVAAWVGAHSPALAAAIRSTTPDSMRHDEIRAYRHRGRWAGARTVLLGDAAHAMVPALGQGACQALEDAAVLVRALQSSSVPDALAAYQRLRPRRTRMMVTGARLMLQFRQHPAAGAMIRLTPRAVAEATLPLAVKPPPTLS